MKFITKKFLFKSLSVALSIVFCFAQYCWYMQVIIDQMKKKTFKPYSLKARNKTIIF